MLDAIRVRARRNPFYTSDLLRTIPGLQVIGEGYGARLVSLRGYGSCVTL